MFAPCLPVLQNQKKSEVVYSEKKTEVDLKIVAGTSRLLGQCVIFINFLFNTH